MNDPILNCPDRPNELQKALESLYKTFAPYTLRPHVEGCPCCVTQSDNQQLHQRPLRTLSAQDLERFAFKTMTTWGSEEDFKHFLPRLFEIMLSPEGFGAVDSEILLGKLAYSNWNSWPIPERIAVKRFLIASWQYKLVEPDWKAPLDWLCAIAQAENDLQPYLDLWSADPEPQSIRNLAEILTQQGNQVLFKGKLQNAFWENRRPPMNQAIHWLATSAVRATLEKAFFQNASTEHAELFSLACTVQEALVARSDSGSRSPHQ